MVYLAGENRIVPSRELETKISFPQQTIFSAGRKLKKLGFINTVAGPFGGYILSKSPEKITIQEILDAFNDGFCISSEEFTKKSSVPSIENFAKKLKSIKNEMEQQMSFSIADLLKER